MVARRTVGRVSPRRRRHAAGLRARRADAHRTATHLGRAKRGSNLGARQPSSLLRVGSLGVSAALDHRFGNRSYPPAAAAERRAAAGMVSTASGDCCFHPVNLRSEEHTSELQSPCNLVCRLLLEKKKKMPYRT